MTAPDRYFPHKTCSICGKTKERSEFTLPSDAKTGRNRGQCNLCRVEKIRDWANKNRQAVNTNQRNYNKTIRGRSFLLLNAAKRRSVSKKEDFKLKLEDVMTGLENGRCVRTGIEFDFANTIDGKSVNPFSPSIDKIKPNGIYEPSNVQYVCSWYNLAKRDLDESLFLFLCELITDNKK